MNLEASGSGQFDGGSGGGTAAVTTVPEPVRQRMRTVQVDDGDNGNGRVAAKPEETAEYGDAAALVLQYIERFPPAIREQLRDSLRRGEDAAQGRADAINIVSVFPTPEEARAFADSDAVDGNMFQEISPMIRRRWPPKKGERSAAERWHDEDVARAKEARVAVQKWARREAQRIVDECNKPTDVDEAIEKIPKCAKGSREDVLRRQILTAAKARWNGEALPHWFPEKVVETDSCDRPLTAEEQRAIDLAKSDQPIVVEGNGSSGIRSQNTPFGDRALEERLYRTFWTGKIPPSEIEENVALIRAGKLNRAKPNI